MKAEELKYVTYNQELFNHMKDEHDLTLLHSEMLEIELICNKELIKEHKKFIIEYKKDVLDSYKFGFNAAVESLKYANVAVQKQKITKETGSSSK